MAKVNLLETKTVNLNEIIGNGKIYRVPQFQRDYSWDQDNWEDLWNDLLNVKTSGQPHYMGSVVFQNTGGKEYLIIDGQQRFTTLSILTLAFISKIEKLAADGIDVEANRERVEILMRQYIGQKDPASLHYSSKLFLNENNDAFYQQRLLAFKPPINENKLSDSERLMWRAYKFFQDTIEKDFNIKSGADLASSLNNIVGESLMFIQITVEDEINAYTVFETLNSRGVELTSTDLLKNYLFSRVARSQTDLGQVKSQWKRIIDAIGLKEFPTFLRYYLQATRRMITREYLFKAVKIYVKTDSDVFDLLEHLEKYAYIYIALGSVDDELWQTDKELKSLINELKLFRVTQWKTLSMVAHEKLSPADFKRLLHAIVVISYRYNLIGKQQTNEMEKVYSKAAINLFNNTQPAYQATINDLRSLYLSDEEFKGLFELRQFKTGNSIEKKQLRYTLYKIEYQVSEGQNAFDFEADNGTIEHILPESYPESWHEHFSEDEFVRNVNMIGNLTLLEPSKNNKLAGDGDFESKKSIYTTSKYRITQEITASEWNPRLVKKRQSYLAKIACGVWKLSGAGISS